MSARVSCPYCNAGFALLAVPAGGRVDCPRCGERFPLRVPVDPGGPMESRPPEQVAAAPTPQPTNAGPSRRAVLLAVGLVVVGLGVAAVYRFRRPAADVPPGPADSSGVAAVDLPGLGYLPPGANVAFAARPGLVTAYAARTGQDPVTLLTGLGVPPAALGTLARAGLTLDDIDHVAGGAVIPDADAPAGVRLAVVLALRRPPADEDRFLDSLQARRSVRDGKTRYAVTFAGLPLTLAKASPTVWVFGWSDADADAAGGVPLSAGLRGVVAERLPADVAVWAAAEPARWADKPLVKLGAGPAFRPEWLPVLAQGRAAAVGLSAGDPATARAAVQCADAPTADRLRAYFAAKSPAGSRAEGAGEWATVDAPATPPVGLGAFRELIDGAGK